MSTTRTQPQFLITLRGPAGAGKTALAKSVQAAADQLVATIDSDLFNWEIVPGESDKALVYRNLVMLAENYLRGGYSVVVSGLIISSEEAGAMQKLRQFAASRGAVLLDFYCSASRDLVVQRNRTRYKQVPEAAVLRWWERAELDKPNVSWELITLDMSAELSSLTGQVLATVDAAHGQLLASGTSPPESRLRQDS
ncbi:MAG: hypothetical protein CL878_07850 [Dehalococcoidia bacterium]|nr:hypothetical protein [Dehalococcoidia bacterium]